MPDLAKKRAKEQRIVDEMIALYCKRHHAGKRDGKRLCPECAELSAYARKRSECCPFMENKTFCSNCATSCYTPTMRERIREVMRYAGPRMPLHHPALALWYLVCKKRGH